MAKPKSQHTAPTAFPHPVRYHAMQVGKWLLQVAAYRKNLSVDDRLETLLWSWPIRRALTAQDMKRPLWTDQTRHRPRTVLPRNRMGREDDSEQLKANIEVQLPILVRSWYPSEPPEHRHSTPEDREHHRVCELFCDELRQLDAPVPHEANDTAALARFIEDRWGDGEYEYRRQRQDDLLAPLDDRTVRQVCAIAEQARDRAYVSVQATRLLDELRDTKNNLDSFIEWLRHAPDHAPLVNDLLRPFADDTIPDEEFPHRVRPFRDAIEDFYDAFRTLVTHHLRIPEVLRTASRDTLDHDGRDRRLERGKPNRPWVAQADQALKALHVGGDQRRELLQVWGLKPLEAGLAASPARSS